MPKVVKLLSISYNAHVRYGTALALGIGCAGTMYSEAIAMLEPLLKDNTDFVRQAASLQLPWLCNNKIPLKIKRCKNLKKKLMNYLSLNQCPIQCANLALSLHKEFWRLVEEILLSDWPPALVFRNWEPVWACWYLVIFGIGIHLFIS